jgi:hypothetical protein
MPYQTGFFNMKEFMREFFRFGRVEHERWRERTDRQLMENVEKEAVSGHVCVCVCMCVCVRQR